VVYFDEDVKDASGKWIGGTWIGLENAKRIAKYFEERNFKRKNSSELGKWINQAILYGNAAKTLVVFAQDVAPYDVFDDVSSNALIRQYLDNGGTILWIGDVPFFYRAEWNGNYFTREVISSGALEVLGVVPVSMIVSSRFSITRNGYKYGLKTNWASLRPIIFPSHLETDRTRLSNFIRKRREFIELAHTEGIGMPWLRPLVRKGHFQRLFEFLGTSKLLVGPIEVKEPEMKESLPVEFGIKYLSAWIKVFKGEGHGFIRVWDYSPRIITDEMLKEIFTLLKLY
jgi:hypothetical protein